MTNINPERDGLKDGMPRDDRGYWQPEDGTAPPNPVFAWPPKPLDVLKWLYHYIFPWNLIYFGIAVVTWQFLTPEMSRMAVLSPDWVLEVFLRNQVMLIVIVSAWHMWLWARKSQGYQFKYTPDWMATEKKQFLWDDQLKDNIFWSIVSGGTIWTVFEVVMYWAYANQIIPFVDPVQQPILFFVVLLLIPLWRLFHFYWTHRLLHVPALYKIAHYVHHKNINVGPWSGLAMHPVEHVLYFSCILIHWIVPSHPIHVILNGQHAAFTPAQGHVGFEKLSVNDNVQISAASYFHQLHHRYFECNYGEPDIPFDHWFGTSHNGSPEDHEAFRARRRAIHKR